jgi:uncharacterized damage-inducible protein DinB
MSRLIAAATFAILLAPAGLAAQESPVVESLAGVHETVKGFITQTAETLSEDLYGFRPTEEVRTAGQILAHVADAQYMFCSTAAGEESPMSESIEQTRTTKAEITSALQAAFAYCDGVYEGLSDAEGARAVSFFGMDLTGAAVLSMNTAHNYEHYGNLVTYMRINGITPPSSQMQGG